MGNSARGQIGRAFPGGPSLQLLRAHPGNPLRRQACQTAIRRRQWLRWPCLKLSVRPVGPGWRSMPAGSRSRPHAGAQARPGLFPSGRLDTPVPGAARPARPRSSGALSVNSRRRLRACSQVRQSHGEPGDTTGILLQQLFQRLGPEGLTQQ